MRLWNSCWEQMWERKIWTRKCKKHMNMQVKHKRVSLYVQRWLSADIKLEDDGSSMLNASKRIQVANCWVEEIWGWCQGLAVLGTI
jgi:hypothetical protein